MPSEDYTPNLSSLEQDYEILTELRRSGESRTYLARHLGLNRDVTITVVHAADAADFQMLTQFAADTRILAKARHPNIIPIIEGRMLANDTFAVVRARVRGSTLDELVSEVGPLPLPRAALQDIFSALEWARKGGIFHRQLSPDDVVFQQGSGRVLLAFDPSNPTVDASWDRCADARTVGRLAWQMLAGRRSDEPDAKTLAALRPDLPRRVVEETMALLNCRREGPAPNIPAYINLLGSPPSVLSSNMSATRIPVPQSVAQPFARFTPLASRKTEEAVVVARHGLGFNARVALAAAALALIFTVVWFFVNRSNTEDSLSASRKQASDTLAHAAGGEVARSAQADTTALVAQPPQVAPGSPRPTNALSSVDTPIAAPRPAAGDSMFAPPAQRRHEPGRTTTPSLVMPTDSSTDSTGAADACASSTPLDQRSCLKSAIQRGDAPVNRVYHQLIAALRLQAGAGSNDPDPQSVTDVRESQTKWLADRDTMCSDVGSGPLYATARAQCYADQSARRVRELQELVDEIPRL
jgi:uncharacterized protein YecT (DUF1311 family)